MPAGEKSYCNAILERNWSYIFSCFGNVDLFFPVLALSTGISFIWIWVPVG